MKRMIAALGVALALGGCVNIGGKDHGPAVVHYVLSDSAPAVSPALLRADAAGDSASPRAEVRGEASAPTLLVLDTTAGSFYDTDQLVFSRSAGTRGQYQYARWTERPGKRFAGLMRSRLDRQGAWRVSDAGGYARGDMLLDTELVELYHDAAANPGQVRLVLRAELLDLKQRKLLGRREFEQRVAVASYDAKGAAEASNVAVGRVLDELVAWLATFQ